MENLGDAVTFVVYSSNSITWNDEKSEFALKTWNFNFTLCIPDFVDLILLKS